MTEPKKNFKALLAEAKRPERTVDICMRGDLVVEFEAADKALREAQAAPSTSKEGGGVAELVEAVERIQAEMAESIYPFRIRALPRAWWRALMKAHPPAEDADDADKQNGFARDTFFDALLKVTTVDPDMGLDVEAYFKALLACQAAGAELPVLPDGDWPAVLDALTDRQYGDLTDAAWFVNRDEVSVPKSLAVLRAKRTTEDE